ncbi:MAG: MXAN_5187 C-terminal domain-containing protein, partial [Planctomycetota bacterium]
RKPDPPAVLQTVVGGPDWDADSLRPLYHKYLEALREHGKDTEDVPFANFSRQLMRKADAVKKRSSCDAVRLRLTIEEGRVLFKARPLRRRQKTS